MSGSLVWDDEESRDSPKLSFYRELYLQGLM